MLSNRKNYSHRGQLNQHEQHNTPPPIFLFMDTINAYDNE